MIAGFLVVTRLARPGGFVRAANESGGMMRLNLMGKEAAEGEDA
jgi:hypothetical protein